MSKSSNKTGLQCFMQHQILAALHLSALNTLGNLSSHLYSFCWQEKVAQPVLQTHLQPKEVGVNPKAPTNVLSHLMVTRGPGLQWEWALFFHSNGEGKQVKWCLEKGGITYSSVSCHPFLGWSSPDFWNAFACREGRPALCKVNRDPIPWVRGVEGTISDVSACYRWANFKI